MSLKNATAPVNQFDTKAALKRQETRAKQIEFQLTVNADNPGKLALLQQELVRVSSTIAHLQQSLLPRKTDKRPGGRMKHFAGLDPYYYNG